ncbi:MAG: hypothetical protein HQM08_00040 [Candidatus Riflebacteria bacterium]|nr:hypothetical protein [Candidatus Riflebacteria bacterium]
MNFFFIWATLLLLLFSPNQVFGEKMIKIEFNVQVPKDTDKNKGVFLAGNHEKLGSWKPDGVRLFQEKDKSWHFNLEVPINTPLSFKITQGDWKSVEKNSKGLDIKDRRLTAIQDSTIDVIVEKWGGGPVPSTLTGDIRFHKKFYSSNLKNERTIIVYLPPDYEKQRKMRCPVFYMHDGQNIFDASTCSSGFEWQADETAERLIKSGRLPPMIIVGIYNNEDRVDEYLPIRDKERQKGGKASKYAKFVVEEVKPFIDKTYRTLPGKETTGICGSSFGGLVSLYICSKYPQVFSMCGIVSPGLWVGNAWILKQVKKTGEWLKGVRFWLDMGSQEGDDISEFNEGIQNTRDLEKIFLEKGLLPGRDYYYLEVAGGRHHESDWAERFDKILLYFFGNFAENQKSLK